jgi:HEAT repeat protein
LLLVGNSSDPGLKAVVEAAFTDKEWSVRAAAAHVAAMHPFPEMRGSLVPLLDDKKDAVQVRAAAAYLRLEHESKAATASRHAGDHHARDSAPNKTAQP